LGPLLGQHAVPLGALEELCARAALSGALAEAASARLS